jgi:undecaprenyl-diphosphatase
MHEWLAAVVLGIVEGLTEFLPVSSTGHLILAGELLGFVGERAGTFEIFIQLGAILAVVWLYRERFARLVGDGLAGRALMPRPGEPALTWAHLVVAMAPVLAAGLLLRGTIRAHLFTSSTVLIGLVVGAVYMVGSEVAARRRPATAGSLDRLSLPQALGIGCLQCLSLWPGFSRSGATIGGGLLAGLDRRTAAEFSFVLAVPVMIAATGYDLLRSLALLDRGFTATLALGFAVSFVVAWAAVVGFLRVVGRVSLVPFAVYRVALAALWALVILP